MNKKNQFKAFLINEMMKSDKNAIKDIIEEVNKFSEIKEGEEAFLKWSLNDFKINPPKRKLTTLYVVINKMADEINIIEGQG